MLYFKDAALLRFLPSVLVFVFEGSRQKTSSGTLNEKSEVTLEIQTSCSLTGRLRLTFALGGCFVLHCVASLELGHCILVKTEDSRGLWTFLERKFQLDFRA